MAWGYIVAATLGPSYSCVFSLLPANACPSRCDVRNATRTVAVVAVIDWLLALRERTRARVTATSTAPQDSPAASSSHPLEGANDAANDIVNDGGDASDSASVAVREASGVSAGEREEREEEEAKGEEEESSGAGEQAAEVSSDGGKSGSSGVKGKKAVGGREGGAKDSLPRDLLLVTGTARSPVS